eukprot:2013312-Rhodomonas_salina.4
MEGEEGETRRREIERKEPTEGEVARRGGQKGARQRKEREGASEEGEGKSEERDGKGKKRGGIRPA